MPCHPDKDNLNAKEMAGGMGKQKETEQDGESDAIDGSRRQSADAPVSHQKAADNHKYHTVGHQVLLSDRLIRTYKSEKSEKSLLKSSVKSDQLPSAKH